MGTTVAQAEKTLTIITGKKTWVLEAEWSQQAVKWAAFIKAMLSDPTSAIAVNPVTGVRYTPPKDIDIHAITGALKDYFRELPEPVLTFELYQKFIDAVGNVEETKALVAQLPESHWATLELLCAVLVEITKCAADNKMTATNLGVVFGPTLMRPPERSDMKVAMKNVEIQNRVIATMIENKDTIFDKAAFGASDSIAPQFIGHVASTDANSNPVEDIFERAVRCAFFD
jgi:hypothetical protein